MASMHSTKSVPLRGFGTFQSDPSAGSVKDSVLAALDLGYRHIDTAFAYSNGQAEREVGEAFRESGIPREDLYIVSKLHNTYHKPEDVEVGLDISLKNLGMEYVDLYLMHNPYAYCHDEDFNAIRHSDGSGKPLIDVVESQDYPKTWRAMEVLLPGGKTRSIGVSNFNVLKMKHLIRETTAVPIVNQVEFNPYFPQMKLLAFCKAHGVQLVAHCPLGGALASEVTGRQSNGPLQDPVIKQVAFSHQKSVAQVILAWIIGRGVCVIPQSRSRSHIAENFDCVFRLTRDEDKQIGEIMGLEGEHAVRNMDSKHHIGFDSYDELVDQPV